MGIIDERDTLSQVLLEASEAGAYLWRNNVGAVTTNDGRFIRFGLANQSEQSNAVIKSADLIGIRPVLITHEHVGLTVGQFISREIKSPAWKFSNKNKRDVAQLRWAQLINSLGGDACFATSRGTL